MNKLLLSSLLAITATAFLTACGDETTNVTSTTGPTSVAKFKDLDECTSENSGDLVYVKDLASVYFCADSVWKEMSASAANGSDGKDGKNGENGADGKDGKNGVNGTSCTAKALKDSSGFELTCGGKVIGTISNGRTEQMARTERTAPMARMARMEKTGLRARAKQMKTALSRYLVMARMSEPSRMVKMAKMGKTERMARVAA